MLDELARSNLFVVPLDAVGEQYRFHHLFGDLVRTELRRREPELEPELHARASVLFESRGETDFAVRHARRAGDFGRAAAARLGRRAALPRERAEHHRAAVARTVHPGADG